MEPEITIEIRSGNVVLSFKTDRTGSNVKDGIMAIKEILSVHESLFRSFRLEKDSESHELKVQTTGATLSSLNMASDVREKVVSKIRQLSMFDLVLIFLKHAPLTYEAIMKLSKEVGKPITYDWLNTEFHRKRYRGLVKSDPIKDSKEKIYSLSENGRKRAEEIVEKIKK